MEKIEIAPQLQRISELMKIIAKAEAHRERVLRVIEKIDKAIAAKSQS